MNLRDLEGFVAEAVANGWPDNTVARTDEEFPGFYGGTYQRDGWRYLDLWSGATTDAGMMIVFFQDSPVWTCTYRGGILRGSAHVNETTIAANEVFGFLVQALRADHDSPLGLRGPASYVSDDNRWRYRFEVRGDVEGFVAIEQIHERDRLAYERILLGGCVGDGVAYARTSLDLSFLTEP